MSILHEMDFKLLDFQMLSVLDVITATIQFWPLSLLFKELLF